MTSGFDHTFEPRIMAEPVEDCRDYLRTGRCKYGASCKYNHPSNVQSGGGMKAPLDPSEPLFPVRPNEPMCQYYMKHGTCKFGQACKFNHPPQRNSMQGMINGQTVLMNVAPGMGRNEPQLVLNSLPVDASGSPMMLQFLPQRPDQPDCIYFLKNGRCKYGTTCRYHHPVKRRDEPRRRGDSFGSASQSQKVQYVAHSIPSTSFSQGSMVLSDSQVSFVSVDGMNPQKYHVVSNGETVPVYYNSNVPTESSTSSLASSYDTASSSLEQLAAQGDAASALWNRVKKNGSGGSLNAYDSSRPHTSQMHPSTSDGSINSRRRAASYGSDNSGAQHDGGAPPGLSSGPWRGEHRSLASPQYRTSNANPEYMQRGLQGPPRRSPRSRGSRQGDEGFTMMTSALLNMLDTTEEASGESVSDEDPRFHLSGYHVQDEDLAQLRFDRFSMNDSNHGEAAYEESNQGWNQRWFDNGSQAHPTVHNQASQMQRHYNQDTGSPHQSDVGLYLP